MVPCICGLLAGAFYRSDVASIKQWRFPDRLHSFSTRYIQPSLATPPIPRPNNVLPIQRPTPSFGMEGLVASATGIGLNAATAATTTTATDNLRQRSSAENAIATNTAAGSSTRHEVSDDDEGRSTTSTASTTSSITSNHITRAVTTSTMREYLATLTGNAPLTSTEIQPPSQEHMMVLISMFPDHSRESITNALAAAHNNINRAVEIMLHTPVPSTSNL